MYAEEGDILQFCLQNEGYQFYDEKETRYSFGFAQRRIIHQTTTVKIDIFEKGRTKSSVHRNFDRFNVVESKPNILLELVTIHRNQFEDEYLNRPESSLILIVT